MSINKIREVLKEHKIRLEAKKKDWAPVVKDIKWNPTLGDYGGLQVYFDKASPDENDIKHYMELIKKYLPRG